MFNLFKLFNIFKYTSVLFLFYIVYRLRIIKKKKIKCSICNLKDLQTQFLLCQLCKEKICMLCLDIENIYCVICHEKFLVHKVENHPIFV